MDKVNILLFYTLPQHIYTFTSNFTQSLDLQFDKCLLLYVQFWTPDDGRKDRPKYVECLSK